ncbi:MAG: peptide chain release factor N(5)-glutamine methyltransferase [Pseudomonadota bacterium]
MNNQLVTSIKQTLQAAAEALKALSHSTPELEASVLLCHLLGKSRSFLYAWPDKLLTELQSANFEKLIKRRLEGEPIAHITGVREFWSLTLKVTSATLIPRPETELLVEQALEHLQKTPSPMVADLGAGSGAIALAIANERPDCTLHATDASDAALKIAGENIQSLNLKNVVLHHGDWFHALPKGVVYDLILSNPPYIAEQDPHLSQGDLPREPGCALTSGTDGLNDIRIIVSQAPQQLKPGGWLLLEHGYEQGEAVRDLLQKAGFRKIRTLRDLAGHERVSEGRRPDPSNQ